MVIMTLLRGLGSSYNSRFAFFISRFSIFVFIFATEQTLNGKRPQWRLTFSADRCLKLI